MIKKVLMNALKIILKWHYFISHKVQAFQKSILSWLPQNNLLQRLFTALNCSSDENNLEIFCISIKFRVKIDIVCISYYGCWEFFIKIREAFQFLVYIFPNINFYINYNHNIFIVFIIFVLYIQLCNI